VLLSLAQFLRNAGYQAVASLNDTALAIPYAVQAGEPPRPPRYRRHLGCILLKMPPVSLLTGLGEYGRHGLLIHPEHGPRVRIGKLWTDLPLAHDEPRRSGVAEFCAVCDRCATACPAQAISYGPAGGAEHHNQSNLRGVRKWTTNAEKCFSYWTQSNAACSVCIRVCPYNRGSGAADRAWRYLAGTPLRRLMLALDDASGRAKRLRPAAWWGAGAAR